MLDASRERQSRRWAAPERLTAGLLVPVIVVGIAAATLPLVRVGETAAGIICFAGATLSGVLGLAVATTAPASLRLAMTTAGLALVVLASLAWFGAPFEGAPIAVDAAIVAVAWGFGSSIGQRVQHPGHLLPACIVIACADVASLVSPHGPTHALAASDRALSIVAFSFPVPGTRAFAPSLGVGDLVFVAIVLGAVRIHRLPYFRAVGVCLLGAFAAGAISAVLQVPVPALVPLAAAVVLGLPAVRHLRRQDRRVALWAIAIAAVVSASAIGSQVLFPPASEPVGEVAP